MQADCKAGFGGLGSKPAPNRAMIPRRGRVAEWFKAPVLKTGMGASPSWVRTPPRKSSSYPGIILIDHRACPNRCPTRLEMGGTYPRADTGSNRLSPGHSADLVLMLETAQLLGGPPQRRFINPLCGCGSSAADPPAPIDPPTIPTETRRTGRGRSLEVSERASTDQQLIVASQSRGPAVPEQAHLAPAAPLWGPMYPTGNIQKGPRVAAD